MPVMFMAPHEVAQQIAQLAKEKRLLLNFSQQTLSDRSGVSLGVIKKFEITGKVSLESLLKVALALDCLSDFMRPFKQKPLEQYSTIDDLFKTNARKRGRK